MLFGALVTMGEGGPLSVLSHSLYILIISIVFCTVLLSVLINVSNVSKSNYEEIDQLTEQYQV